MKGKAQRALLVLFLALLCLAAEAQYPPTNKKAKAPAVKTDIPFIKCGVCQELTKALVKDVKELRESKGNKFKEDDVLERVEKMCDPEAEAGEWITRMDVVEDGSKLKLVDQGSPGKCGSECRTIARACSDILGDSDTDLGEAMYRRAVQASGGGVSRGWLEPYLCHTVSKACAAPAPPVPATRPKGPKFEAKTQQEVEMDKLMRTMAGVPGMPGMSMYSRDDLAGMSEGMGEDDDEDDGVQEAMMKNKKPASKSSKKGSAPSSDGIVGAISDTLSDAATQAGQALDGAVEKVANAASNAWSWAEKKFGGGADL